MSKRDSLCLEMSAMLLSPRSAAIFIRPWPVLCLHCGQKLRQMVDFEVAAGAIFTGDVSNCAGLWSRISAVNTVFTLILYHNVPDDGVSWRVTA